MRFIKILIIFLICATVIKLFGSDLVDVNCSESTLDSQDQEYCAFNAKLDDDKIYWTKALLRSINKHIKINSRHRTCENTVLISELNDNLGRVYVNQGNNIKAFEHLSLAAKNGHSLAQFRLSSMYLFGRGVQADEVEAYAWLSTAVYQGIPPVTGSDDINKLAYEAKNELSRDLNLDDIRLSQQKLPKAELKARQYKKLYRSCEH